LQNKLIYIMSEFWIKFNDFRMINLKKNVSINYRIIINLNLNL
jgi:hypothetical protein